MIINFYPLCTEWLAFVTSIKQYQPAHPCCPTKLSLLLAGIFHILNLISSRVTNWYTWYHQNFIMDRSKENRMWTSLFMKFNRFRVKHCQTWIIKVFQPTEKTSDDPNPAKSFNWVFRRSFIWKNNVRI